jgi:hypothetical protein
MPFPLCPANTFSESHVRAERAIKHSSSVGHSPAKTSASPFLYASEVTGVAAALAGMPLVTLFAQKVDPTMVLNPEADGTARRRASGPPSPVALMPDGRPFAPPVPPFPPRAAFNLNKVFEISKTPTL